MMASLVPTELMEIVGKTFLFKFETSVYTNVKYEPSFMVKRVCSDPRIIELYQNPNPVLPVSIIIEHKLVIFKIFCLPAYIKYKVLILEYFEFFFRMKLSRILLQMKLSLPLLLMSRRMVQDLL